MAQSNIDYILEFYFDYYVSFLIRNKSTDGIIFWMLPNFTLLTLNLQICHENL